MTNNNIFLGSGTSVTFVPEVDIYLKPHQTAGTALTDTNGVLPSGQGNKLTLHGDFTGNFDLVNDLYVGCVLEFYDGGTFSSSHRVTTNDATTITFHPAITGGTFVTIVPADDFFRLKGYGAPCPATSGTSNLKNLNADNWLGIVESLTFPSVDVEFKQQNLFVGGSRNFTHQYKGIETAGNASIGIVANHGAWLYYFFGKCSSISATLASGTNPASDFAGNTGSENKYYLENTTLTDTGPLFYRSINNVMTPPVLEGQDAFGDLDQLTESTVGGDGFIDDPITYTFAEQDGDDLPSFAMEQVFSKLPSSNPYSTRITPSGADEDTNFVLIATGNRVNTLTMTANENEELKMTMDCMPRKVHSLEKDEKYAARRSVTDETTFKNFSSDDKLLEPFFFSSGSISLFGQNFLRITQFSLTMNNTLTDKRFIGIGSRNVKDAIPAQRTYELTFSALVTDDKLFNELKNNDENQLADSGALIDLIFDKPNQEQIRLKFDNYYLTTNSWPIPEDKGAVTVDATIIPRSLSSCTVKTHWVLQG